MNDVPSPGDVLEYRRSRFATRLPRDRRYSPMHHWLLEDSPGVWRVGLTAFATWRLGDIVEFDFNVGPGAAISAGDEIGSIEGLKALVPVFSAGSGVFVCEGGPLRQDITLAESDPLGEGWLYKFEGHPGDESLDVVAYAALLDATIDLLQNSQRLVDPGQAPDAC
jgi:glycine cleavage system H protein